MSRFSTKKPGRSTNRLFSPGKPNFNSSAFSSVSGRLISTDSQQGDSLPAVPREHRICSQGGNTMDTGNPHSVRPSPITINQYHFPLTNNPHAVRLLPNNHFLLTIIPHEVRPLRVLQRSGRLRTACVPEDFLVPGSNTSAIFHTGDFFRDRDR